MVDDDEYSHLAAEYQKYAAGVEEMFTKYVAAMQKILENAITAGKVYENLSGFVSHTQLLEGQFQQIVKQLADACSTFDTEVKSDDKYETFANFPAKKLGW